MTATGWTAPGAAGQRLGRRGHQRGGRLHSRLHLAGRHRRAGHGRVPALLQVPLRLHHPAGRRARQALAERHRPRRRAQPGQRLVPPDRGPRAATRRRSSPTASPGPPPTSCGTSAPATPCAASAATRATRPAPRATRPRTRPTRPVTVHASTNRGILDPPVREPGAVGIRAVLRQQGLRPVPHLPHGDPLHEPHRPAAAEGTNFVFHGLHMSGISDKGSGGLDIDTPGAGQGNARCAECHFDSHGTTVAADGPEAHRRPTGRLRPQRPAQQVDGRSAHLHQDGDDRDVHTHLPRQGPPGAPGTPLTRPPLSGICACRRIVPQIAQNDTEIGNKEPPTRCRSIEEREPHVPSTGSDHHGNHVRPGR